jgi:hypothetical protein
MSARQELEKKTEPPASKQRSLGAPVRPDSGVRLYYTTKPRRNRRNPLKTNNRRRALSARPR